MDQRVGQRPEAEGAFETRDELRHYTIRNVDAMAPFFMSVISSDDHWLFVSSTGGLTAGRISAEHAIFPYITVDRIHEAIPHTGPRTIVRLQEGDHDRTWEPFSPERHAGELISRHLHKGLLGDTICFEEHHEELDLVFRYRWETSASFGFVRTCELENTGSEPVSLDILDGLLNLLPAGTPLTAQTQSGNLVDAYKWSELDASTGLGIFTLYAGITDRAEPCESLFATTVFCLGLDGGPTLLSSQQLAAFRAGREIEAEHLKRGIRGAYLQSATVELQPGAKRSWMTVANVDGSQGTVVALQQRLGDRNELAEDIRRSVADGRDQLARIMARADGFQQTAEETVSSHHYANVLFNVLRGGIFHDQYWVMARDFRDGVRHFNAPVAARHEELLAALPDRLRIDDLLERVNGTGDPQLRRLTREYLPITFGRRHGDPSRPWNRFSIHLYDDRGRQRLFYEGNWRDIFQNWEALAFSYPDFIDSIIAKFVNASTIDGFNPYRITKEGIDWEVEDPEDPWSYIGYWGDHQIIYLLKLLEHLRNFHPERLQSMLHEPLFCYANVPYRIRGFEAIVEDAKNTVDYDEALAAKIEARVRDMGADGKLVLDDAGRVYQVTLLEKLLVPLLAKLGNLVAGGGIWLNTQRPEWNDANNALVGNGLSMVTLYYLRRYLAFLASVIERADGAVNVSSEVASWLEETAAVLARWCNGADQESLSATARFELLKALGTAFANYRERVYVQEGFTGQRSVTIDAIRRLAEDALRIVDESVAENRRADGLYHAYNLIRLSRQEVGVQNLYPMLEGQVAVLSSGSLTPAEAADVVDALFASDVFRADIGTFMLYPDRALPGFLERNRVDPKRAAGIDLLQDMLEQGDERILYRDAGGTLRFCAEFRNAGDLRQRLKALAPEFAGRVEASQEAVLELYEATFDHQSFTGRSGTMFGFEGLGCVYWHMVAKLLLAVQENCFRALEEGSDAATATRLRQLYYRVRAGIGFNKSPAEYGAVPLDPYSHTPSHAGASQPGMTGQVKEEVLTRFGELGVRVSDGAAYFEPALLRPCEFLRAPGELRYLPVDGDWETLALPPGALAFTWCQIPVLYRLGDGPEESITLRERDGEIRQLPGLRLPRTESREVFRRSGAIRQLTVTFSPARLFEEPGEQA